MLAFCTTSNKNIGGEIQPMRGLIEHQKTKNIRQWIITLVTSSLHVNPHGLNLISHKVTSHGLNLTSHHMHHGLGHMVCYTLSPRHGTWKHPPVPPDSDIWVSSLGTYSNLFTWGHTDPHQYWHRSIVVATEAASVHPTGIHSCWMYKMWSQGSNYSCDCPDLHSVTQASLTVTGILSMPAESQRSNKRRDMLKYDK